MRMKLKTTIGLMVIGGIGLISASLLIPAKVDSAEGTNLTASVNLTTETTTQLQTTVTTTVETTIETTVENTTAEPVVTTQTSEATYVQTQAQTYTEQPTQTYVQTYAQPVTRYNQVEFLGTFFHVGPVLASDASDRAGVRALANYIDSGGIGAMGAPLNVNDGVGTYIAGHNPGAMSLFANNLQYGSTVTVYDSNGEARHYTATTFVTTPLSGDGGTSNTSKPNAAASALVRGLKSKEILIIQFCIGNTMYLWQLDAQ